MGVHGLWELLAPVGRRVSVETLAGKRLAIDASIWMIQFMKAMRDEKGEMVRNAHILGFFRRICKLLYLRTKPVFVFDGGTPALKRRTVIARRRQRENAQAKIRKTAEKLLLNHLKAMRLKELAADLERQRQNNDVKGKKVIIEEPSVEQITEERIDEGGRSYNQEELDEMLAASLAAEDEGFTADASTSDARVQDDEVYGDEDEDEDEEMILPEMHGKVDPAVLAALPPSMQLDLLVQMREKLMAENRQKYQKVKKAPARFSELQIQAYLKTVAFRREIDGVQKSAAGKGVGGVQTSRIASEANREFIFSSSFTGDKQALTSTGKEKPNNGENQPPSVSSTKNDGNHSPSVSSSYNVVNEAAPTKRSVAAAGPTASETRKAYHDDVETYLDERGRLRVSRVRALGIRMTRDLQRNLDLMKEIELEKAETNQNKNNDTPARNVVDAPENSSDRVEHQGIASNNEGMNEDIDKSEELAVQNGTSFEISFEDTGKNECGGEEDTLFARLVAGESLMDFSVDEQVSHSPSEDCEWEEGVIEDNSKSHPSEGGMGDEGDIEWEDGSLDIPLKASSPPEENHQTVTKGELEEEAEFQEAIRRSLGDMTGHGSYSEQEKFEGFQDMVGDHTDGVSILQGKEVSEVESSEMDVSQQVELTPAMNILTSDSVEEMSPELIEVVPDKTELEPRLLNQESGVSGRLTGELFLASNTQHEQNDMDMAAKQLTATTGEGGDVHPVKKVVDSCDGNGARDSSTSVVRPSITESRPENLLESDPTETAFDDNSCDNVKPAKTLANDLILDSDGTIEPTKENLYGDFPMEKEEHLRESSFTDVGEKDEVWVDNLNEEILFLDKEREALGSEQRKLERNSESVTSEMFAECQELLQMFGLPYIIAPMEAEAQCAYMEISNIVDGVVTDDSDAFLFGARSVYKNIFDDRKYVETYLMKDIEDELGLDREKLIRMALLLGSDYTEGVSGIGIVNAIEVVKAFHEEDGLQKFREWIESPDPTILGKLDAGEGSTLKRKGSKSGETVPNGSNNNTEGTSRDQNVPQSGNDSERIKQMFMNKHRNVSKNWHIPSTFPSDAVISAYASPQVDKSTEPFSWGKPDLFVLRKLCWEKLGWGTSKSDEILLPVLKEYNKRETQLRLEAFYTFNERFAKIRSKRIKKAVKGITGDKSDETKSQHSRSGKKRKVKPSEDETNRPKEEKSLGQESSDTVVNQTGKPTVKQLKGKKTKEKISGKNSEHPPSVDSSPNTRKESGRQRGQGRGQTRGRGQKRKISSHGDSETSCSDDSCVERDIDLQFNRPEESHQVRRSGRTRKIVNYTVCDELEDIDKENESSVNEEATAADNVENELNEYSKIEKRDSIVDETGQEAYTGEKMDASQIDEISQINDPTDRNESPKDYLQFGGGFCVDDDEGKEFDVSTSPTREIILPETCVVSNSPSNITPETSNGATDMSDTKLEMDDRAQKNIDISSRDVTENDTRNEKGSSSLRAMPNLRRKKRKTN